MQFYLLLLRCNDNNDGVPDYLVQMEKQ